MKSFTQLAIILLFISFSSCKVNSSMKQPYASYFVDNNLYLYFIKPLEIKSDELTGLVDFTFKDSSIKNGSDIVVNFTLNNYIFQKNDEAFFEEGAIRTTIKNPTIIFTEVKKKVPISRVTGTFSSHRFIEALKNKDFHLIIKSVTKQREYVFRLSSKSLKKWSKTENNIYSTLTMK